MARGNPGIHSHQVGEVTVTALNDGQFEGSTGLVVGLSAEQSEALLSESFRVLPPRISVSCFLLEWPDRRAVIDFGAGAAYGNVLGHASERLVALGVAPESIDVVLLSHGHIDHVGGLMRDGAAVFPRASLHAHAAEIAFWTGAGRQASNAAVMHAALDAYTDRTVPFQDGDTVLAGVTAVHLPGHTPGHSGFMIESGGASLLFWADVVHLPALQFHTPSAGVTFDTDVEAARAARLRVMDMAATDRLLVAGIHLDFPTFGHVARHGDGFAFESLVWAPTAAGLFT